MKKSLRKLMTPPQSFEEWSIQNNVQSENMKTAESNNKRGILRLIIACCSILLIAISFTTILKYNNSNPADNSPKFYSTTDVSQNVIDLNTLYQTDSLILFDSNTIVHTQKITTDVAKDNESLILSYNIQSALVSIGDSIFIAEYIARTYSNYNFFDELSFTNMQKFTTLHNTDILHKHKDGIVFLRFSKNNVDYFLKVANFDGDIALQDSDIILLLNSLTW